METNNTTNTNPNNHVLEIINLDSKEKKNIIDIKIYNNYFNHFLNSNENTIEKKNLIVFIENKGISINDKRFYNEINKLNDNITFDEFTKLLNTNIILFKKIFENELIISNWNDFKKNINSIYKKIKNNNNGKLASYIPQLAKVDPNLFSISICSIDGQIYNCGDYNQEFCVQSCSKPITYLIASDLKGSEYIHNFVGREPSGKNFNELCLNNDNLPHNPLINSGAIMSCSLIDYNNTLANRYDKIINYWHKLAGDTKINFSTSVYLSEKNTADRNNCLAYMMQESNAFSQGMDKEKYKRKWTNKNLQETLDFYFQCCSIEINTSQASIIASTLANGGICPVTNKRVFSNEIIKNALSLMSSCGMYDYSGEWAYKIGLPAKSGVSGIIICVVPNVMGIAVFSPKLDELGNSFKGIEFFNELSKIYSFHVYENNTSIKKLIFKKDIIDNNFNIYNLLKAASIGDLHSLIILDSKGVDLNSTDYDKRSALHLACSENKLEIVKFLLKKNINTNVFDRWNNKPIEDSIKNKEKYTNENNKIQLDKCNEIIKLLSG